MLTIEQAKKRTEAFLAGQMLEALRAVEYEMPSFDEEPGDVELPNMARAGVEIRHVRGACDAAYLVKAFDEELLMQLQLNVHRRSSCIACRRWTHSMPPPWRYVLIVGASALSMPAGSSAGATRRSQETLAGTTSRLIATLSQVPIFSKTSSSNSIGAPTSSR